MANASQIDNVSEVHFGDCTPAPSAIAHDPNKEEEYQKMNRNLGICVHLQSVPTSDGVQLLVVSNHSSQLFSMTKRLMPYSLQVLELGGKDKEAAYNSEIRLRTGWLRDEESENRCLMVEIFMGCGV